MPAARTGGRLDPPRPPADAAFPLLGWAARYPGGRQLGRLRWAMRATRLPKNDRLLVKMNESILLAGVVEGGTLDGQLAAYRLEDGTAGGCGGRSIRTISPTPRSPRETPTCTAPHRARRPRSTGRAA